MQVNNSLKTIKKHRKWGDIFFYISLLALPFFQYILFYIIVNANSMLLSLKTYELSANGGYTYVFGDNIFGNFRDVFINLFTQQDMKFAIKNSAIGISMILFIQTPLALIFSYYIIKKYTGSSMFRVILFLPSIIAPVILLFIYRTFLNEIYPQIVKLLMGNPGDFDKDAYMYLNGNTEFTCILIYVFFVGFGTNVLLYSGAMSGVNEDIIEAGRLDGVGDFKEFIHIIFPSVWGTYVTFTIVCIVGFFTNDFFTFDLKGEGADKSIYTLGYYLFNSAISVPSGTASGGNVAMYPYLSAMGLVFTFIAAPITMLVKYLLEKFGPSEG